MQNAFDANKDKRNKIKLMITEQNAEPHVAAAALRPDSDSSIENQNGRTSLVGGTDFVVAKRSADRGWVALRFLAEKLNASRWICYDLPQNVTTLYYNLSREKPG